MRLLVVFSHPSTESFGFALFNRVTDTLRASGHEVETLDLYRMGFNPVLSPDDWTHYLSDTDKLTEQVQDHVDLLLWAEGLVFVFPTFYFGVPAMLKGWFERVWLPGITFETAKGRNQRTVPECRTRS